MGNGMGNLAQSKRARGRTAAAQAIAWGAAALLLGACADLLPKASTEVASPWHSFEEAHRAIEQVVPFKTTAADLKAAGIDPFVTPNVQLLTYSDIVLRFPLSGSMPMAQLDRGLRECLEAGNACRGYFISVRETKRDRVGNFWLDSLSFYRVIDVSGWSFNALILIVEGRVVYVIHGGQPVVKEQETNKQPLGPLQGWGDVLPGFIK
jgi:hypothetical protein